MHDIACGMRTTPLGEGFVERNGDKRETVKDRDPGRYGTIREKLSVSPCAPGAMADPVKQGLSLSPLSLCTNAHRH